MATVKLDPAKGVQIPNKTTTERNAISSPETGALVWNTTTSAVNQYNGSAWKEMLRSDGSAASLTAIPAANITGTLHASSGANLTGVGVDGITSSANATAITIDSSERVGIGSHTPGVLFSNIAGTGQNVGAGGIYWNSSEASKYVAQFRNGSNPGWGIAIKLGMSQPDGTDHYIDFIDDEGTIQAALTGANHLTGGLAFQTEGVERFKLGYNGEVRIQESTTDGHSMLVFDSYITLADDASFTINKGYGSIIMISINSGTTMYRSAMFFSETWGGSPVEVADESGWFSNADTDGKICCFKSSNSGSFTIKNRIGVTKALSIATITCGGQ
jgi:hypothetical protein